MRIAATELSTPPDRPQMTLPPFGRPDLGADLGDLGVAIAGHRPVAGHAAHAVDEVGEQFRAVGGVDHLGVELGAVIAPLLVGDDRERRAVADRDDAEAGREGGDLVAVAHPHLVALADAPQPVEQGAILGHGEEGAAELAAALAIGAARLDRAAKLVAHDLLAVADAEDRELAVEQSLRGARAAFLGHAGGRAGEDDAARRKPFERRLGIVEGRDLAIDAGFAHAAGDKLGHLAAEIDDQDRVGGRDGHGGAFDGQTNAREP